MEFATKIINIIDETHDVKTFVVEKPKDFTFIPGQYCMVCLLDDDGEVCLRKPITFSNSPSEPVLELTIKEVGNFTKQIFALKIGDKLKIDGPRGKELNFDGTLKSDIVFVAGGSGITPFRSILRFAVENKLSNNFTLLFGSVLEKDIIYRKELDELDKNNSNIKVVHVVSDDDHFLGEGGYIDEYIIEDYVKDPKEKHWFLCGPPKMIDSIESILDKLGVEKTHIHIDPWKMPGKND